ncbi:hypothetical protein HYU14_06010 [Candidatus Woesearchaeota archaeon]|nr:hypothetical protein [Candidatus Woesearchaeota archaeon]
MVTQSKVNDKRFWALWKGSGAVGDALKAQARDVRRQLMRSIIYASNIMILRRPFRCGLKPPLY